MVGFCVLHRLILVMNHINNCRGRLDALFIALLVENPLLFSIIGQTTVYFIEFAFWQFCFSMYFNLLTWYFSGTVLLGWSFLSAEAESSYLVSNVCFPCFY
jgi:hypothetical protein